MSLIKRRVPRGTRGQGDWCYRANTASATPFAADNLGSYDVAVRTLTAGPTTGGAVVLYDSHAYLQQVSRIGAGGVLGLVAGSARASSRRPTITAVRGFLNIVPSTWAIGNVVAFRWRILAVDQDMETGFALLDTTYTSWAAGVAGRNAAYYRNQTRCLAEGTLIQAYASANDAAMFNLGVHWRGRWRLGEEDALFLYVEAQSTSVNVRWQSWCSTRVIAGSSP